MPPDEFVWLTHSSPIQSAEDDTEEEARVYDRVLHEIFEEQLDGWYRIPSAWPFDPTFDTFTGGLSTGFVPSCSISAMIR